MFLFLHKWMSLIWSRNKRAEELFGYSSEEAIGCDALEIMTDPQDHGAATEILHRGAMGENWTGQFPVKNKAGGRFLIIATNTPLYDDAGKFVGVICVSNDTRPFEEVKAVMMTAQRGGCGENASNFSRPSGIASGKLGLDPQQPLQVAIASKISNLVSIRLLGFVSIIFIVYVNSINISNRLLK